MSTGGRERTGGAGGGKKKPVAKRATTAQRAEREATPAPSDAPAVVEHEETEHDEVLEPEVLGDELVADAALPDVLAEQVDGLDDSEPGHELALAPSPGRSVPAPFDPLARYIQEVRRFPELDRDEEQRLARHYRETGDPGAARRLITAHLMLVVKLALMYRRAIRNVMDLIQEGNVGLLEALKRFDPDQGVRFPTYAAWWIKAYMLKFLLDNARLVRIGTTNARRKLLYNLRREREKLERQGISVTPRLLAEHFGVSESDVVEVDRAIAGRDVSVDAPITEDGSLTLGDTLSAPMPSAEDVVSHDEVRERVAAAIAEFRVGLNERELAILDQRLVADEPSTLQELGDRFGVTREAMRQAENKLKERLGVFLKDKLGSEVILQFTQS